MTDRSTGNLTQMLESAAAGDREAFDAVLALVYDDLKAIALHHARREREDHTLQATALVHEAYLKLAGSGALTFRDRVHFFATASQIIRRILVDHARKRGATKRGGDRHRLTIEEALVPAGDGVDLVDLDDAMSKLATIDPLQARIVEMRFFGGLTIDEASDVLDVSSRTVNREWNHAKAWLRHQLRPAQDEASSDDGR